MLPLFTGQLESGFSPFPHILCCTHTHITHALTICMCAVCARHRPFADNLANGKRLVVLKFRLVIFGFVRFCFSISVHKPSGQRSFVDTSHDNNLCRYRKWAIRLPARLNCVFIFRGFLAGGCNVILAAEVYAFNAVTGTPCFTTISFFEPVLTTNKVQKLIEWARWCWLFVPFFSCCTD